MPSPREPSALFEISLVLAGKGGGDYRKANVKLFLLDLTHQRQLAKYFGSRIQLIAWKNLESYNNKMY